VIQSLGIRENAHPGGVRVERNRRGRKSSDPRKSEGVPALMGMSGSSIQTSKPPAQGASKDHRRSPRGPVGQVDAHRPTHARAARGFPRLDIVLSSGPARTDDDLVREINAEHGQVETYKHNTIQHAIRCGELLLEMKQRVGHGNWLAWVEEHFEASERTARNYMEIAKSAAVADLHNETTMRSALRALASRSQPKEQKDERAGEMAANSNLPTQHDMQGVGVGEIGDPPRAGLDTTARRTWASVPERLSAIKRVFSEAAGEKLDDRGASEVLYMASREAHQAAIDLERLAAALRKRAE
jgi:hypothetical protein